MFTLKVDRRARLMEVTFSGHLDADDIRRLYVAAATVFAAEGPMDTLYDYTLVESVAVPDSVIADRGQVPQMCPGYRRVIVASNPELLHLLQLYAAHQVHSGSVPPAVVKSKGMAFSYLATHAF